MPSGLVLGGAIGFGVGFPAFGKNQGSAHQQGFGQPQWGQQPPHPQQPSQQQWQPQPYPGVQLRAQQQGYGQYPPQ